MDGICRGVESKPSMTNDSWKTDLDQLIEDEQSYSGPMISDDHLFLSLSDFISKLLSSQEEKIREEEHNRKE